MVITDGQKNDKSLSDTYDIGAKKLLNLSNYIFKNYNCKFISAFALSKDNLKRSNKVIKIVKKIIEKYVNQLGKENSKIKFNVKIIGNISILSKEIQNKIYEINKYNSQHKKNLIIFFNYSGSDDIIMSLTKIQKKLLKDKSNFSNFLLTKNTPDPDILLRTGGYQRLSDFLLYQIRYTELFFLKKHWPDLTNRDLDKIILKNKKIKRNYGR